MDVLVENHRDGLQVVDQGLEVDADVGPQLVPGLAQVDFHPVVLRVGNVIVVGVADAVLREILLGIGGDQQVVAVGVGVVAEQDDFLAGVDFKRVVGDAALGVDQEGEALELPLVELGQEKARGLVVGDRRGQPGRYVGPRLLQQAGVETLGELGRVRGRGGGGAPLADDVVGVVGEAQHGGLEVGVDGFLAQEPFQVLLFERDVRRRGVEPALPDEDGPGDPAVDRRGKVEIPGEGHFPAVALEGQVGYGSLGLKFESLQRVIERLRGPCRLREPAACNYECNKGYANRDAAPTMPFECMHVPLSELDW